MPVSTFAAIDVGSNEVSMKIFQIEKKNNIKQLTHIRHIMELGSDTYASGYISNYLINELCDVLNGFTKVMADFGVTAYSAYSTSSIREAANRHFLLDRIRVRTNLDVNMLGNAEQRYLLFQAIAINEPDFNDIINKGALVVEVGSGSSQATCFSGGLMQVSQNLRLGSIRINEFLGNLERTTDSYNDLLAEYIEGDIYTSYTNHFHEYTINTILAVGEGIRTLQKYINSYYPDKSMLSSDEMNDVYKTLYTHSINELAHITETSEEQAHLILPTAMIYKKIMDINHAHFIKFNSTDLCDGMVAEYAILKHKIKPSRDFSQDIISASKKLAYRYSSNIKHTAHVEKIAQKIFDGMKKISGLSERDLLLLRVAIILHDCGAFVNFQEVSENSYDIIRSSEIIGLSLRESTIIANIVRHHTYNFPPYSDMEGGLSEEDYIKTAKLTALFRICNDLDTSKKQKLSHIKISLKNDKLIINAESFMDLALEQAYFNQSTGFFEQTFGIKPVLKQRRISNV